MDAEKFTKKSLEVIESCEKLAYEYNNQELTQAHLMYALVTVEDSLIAKLLTNMGINMDAFTGECEKTRIMIKEKLIHLGGHATEMCLVKLFEK